MKLNDWMKQKEIGDADLAKLLGLRRTDSIQRWKNGECFPQKRHREKIFQVTGGQVTATDLLSYQ
jgi:hypothetical protein